MNNESNAFWVNADFYDSFEMRAHRFAEELRPVYFNYLGIAENSFVLDGGCGTGVFTRYLGRGLRSGKILGFDLSEKFIAYGNTKVKEENLSERVSLEVADGFALPYASNTFDAVTNYTYIGVLSDPIAGLNELIRVCKPGGVVSCVVATTEIPRTHWLGEYPFDGAERLIKLADKEKRVYREIHDPCDMKQSSEWHSLRYPKLFDVCGLANIHFYPIAGGFCYNDTRHTPEYRRMQADRGTTEEIRYLQDRWKYNSEKLKEHGFSEEEYRELVFLLERKRQYLLEHLEDDKSFEWEAGLNFIVTGTK